MSSGIFALGGTENQQLQQPQPIKGEATKDSNPTDTGLGSFYQATTRPSYQPSTVKWKFKMNGRGENITIMASGLAPAAKTAAHSLTCCY